MRPAPPAYPRPVPEIVFEDDSVVLEDKAPTDDIEQRAAKRRRIEAFARSYLRGEEVFILSAGLRGPLSKNWKNPWAKKNRVTSDDGVGLKKQHKQQTSERSRRASPTSLPKPSLAPEDKSIRAAEVADPFQSTEPAPNGTSPAQKVEDWLRTSCAYARQRRTSPLSSPTPKASAADKTKPNNARSSATPPVRLPPTSSQVPPAPLGPAPGKAFELSQATTTDGMEVVNAAHAHSRLQSILQMKSATAASAVHLPPASSCPAFVLKPDKSTHQEDNNAELERTTTQQPPFSTDPVLASEHHELRSARRSKYLRSNDNRESQVGQEISARPTAIRGQSKAEQSKTLEQPQQSAPTSVVASIEPLPSAQHRSEPLFIPQPSESEQPLPDLDNEQPTSHAMDGIMRSVDDQAAKCDGLVVDVDTRPAQPQEEVLVDPPDGIPPPMAEVGDDYLESLEVTGASEAVFVTPLSENHNSEPQPEQPKTSKRTSFAASINIERPPSRPQGSNSSLKSVLKTSKSSSVPAKPKEPESLNVAPKSILKRNGTTASSPTFSAPKQQSTIPNGQNVRRMSMNGVEDFDLDAAVDDLGSFLSTWDEELGLASA